MELKDIKDECARNVTEQMLGKLDCYAKDNGKVEILNYMLVITISRLEKKKV